MELTFASYNIHKAVGMDRRRDPERVLAVLHELQADVIALQEVDRRIGERESVLPRAELEEAQWQIAAVARRPRSLGWHGNAILVRRGLEIADCTPLDLPTIEPRGAACAEIVADDRRFRVFGTHLDLSGLRRRDQIRTLLGVAAACDRGLPSVILGDFNQWGRATGAMRDFAEGWHMIAPGKSYPANRPLAHLDRVVASPEWHCHEARVHRTPLAALASDHLPIVTRLELVKN